MARVAKRTHPTFKKVDKLNAFLEENQLRLCWNGYYLTVEDTENKVEFRVKDMDSNTTVDELPPIFEYILVVNE